MIGAVTGSTPRPATVLLGRYTPDGDLLLVARSTPLAAPVRTALSNRLTPVGPGHPWHGMHVTSHWGSRDPLEFTPIAPHLVSEFSGDTAIDQDRWRHSVRLVRLRPDLTVEDLPLLE
ncbi:hypothetical protein [Streptomyces sp. 2A115]|uniref:hypothetical protein n=1 Tax=Streptomyces sp. 2A115 TaxID=3457439 RepID=UPI003FCF9EA1